MMYTAEEIINDGRPDYMFWSSQSTFFPSHPSSYSLIDLVDCKCLNIPDKEGIIGSKKIPLSPSLSSGKWKW